MRALPRLITFGVFILTLHVSCHSQTTEPTSTTPKERHLDKWSTSQSPMASGPGQAANASSVGSPTVPPLKDVNPEILKLVIADQWDRGNDMFGKGQVRSQNTLDWKTIGEHDALRHKIVRELLAADKLKTTNDYSFAALIFQHSGDPSDLMLAHLLSSTAVAMGGDGKWMMAATMDRYLDSIKQPQIFGTQFRSDGQHWTMEPYNRTTLTDAERALWCVVPLARQETILKDYQTGKDGASTAIEGCK
jgi:hypothetical protein